MTNNSIYHKSVSNFLDSNLKTIADLIDLKQGIQSDTDSLKRASANSEKAVFQLTESQVKLEKDIGKKLELHNCLLVQTSSLEKTLLFVQEAILTKAYQLDSEREDFALIK